MCTLINIHTHQPTKEEGVLQIQNVFPFDTIPQNPFSVGIHPWHIEKNWKAQWQEVEIKAKNANCLAIGECGLDTTVATPLKEQAQLFEQHIFLANSLQKPLILHCVKAYDTLLQMHKKITVPVILHDFGKSPELGIQLQKKGIYLSIGKALFRESFAKTLARIDLSMLFLETDDMPLSITKIYTKAAQILNCTTEALAQKLHENYSRVIKSCNYK